MKSKKRTSANPIIFKANMKIGEAGAEDDSVFLHDCFVHTADLDTLLNLNCSERIVLGRTGIGKSALLQYILHTKKTCIKIEPDELALNYITNSTILPFFESLGVRLDNFYQLLWRHILVVALLKDKYSITNETAKNSLFQKLSDVFSRDKTKQLAIEYIEKWGDKFWLETLSRVKEVTSKIEESLRSGIDLSNIGVPVTASGAQKLSVETKDEIVHRAQQIVNDVQLSALAKVYELLDDDIFNDHHKPYYIAIDRLDENWVDNQLRYKLIRALVETIKSFKKVRNVKIIIALRLDLLQRVIQETRDSGFQEEKYESLYLNLRWSKEQLVQLLNNRINFLLRKQYSGDNIKLEDIVPEKIIEQNFLDYMLDRTLLRPRDVIAFMNAYLARMVGQQKITSTQVYEAEIDYSNSRLRALFDEWNADYTNISEYYSLLRERESHFPLSKFSKDDVDNFAISLGSLDIADEMKISGEKYIDENRDPIWLLSKWAKILYRIGLIGIKLDTHTSVLWSYQADAVISEHQITLDSIIYIHPMFWRSLGIHAKNRKKGNHAKNSKKFITSLS